MCGRRPVGKDFPDVLSFDRDGHECGLLTRHIKPLANSGYLPPTFDDTHLLDRIARLLSPLSKAGNPYWTQDAAHGFGWGRKGPDMSGGITGWRCAWLHDQPLHVTRGSGS